MTCRGHLCNDSFFSMMFNGTIVELKKEFYIFFHPLKIHIGKKRSLLVNLHAYILLKKRQVFNRLLISGFEGLYAPSWGSDLC